MKMAHIITMKPLRSQKGMTLVELLVAGVISLIAVSGMVLVMSSTLGTSAYTIKMSRLTHDMRTAMQIMTRELRRANYHDSWIACYGNTGCRTDLGITDQINLINIGDSAGTNDCLWFWYDRPQFEEAQVDLVNESVAAFRRAETDDGVGIIQMTTILPDIDNCKDSAGWVDITDPNIMDVVTFTVTKVDAARPSICEEINSAGAIQNVEKIGLVLTARLTADGSIPAWIQDDDNDITIRTLDEFVTVRNNTTARASTCI